MQYKSYPVISAYRKSSIKPPGGGDFKPTLREGLIEPGGILDEGIFCSERRRYQSPKRTIENKVEKLKYKKVGGHAAEHQNQIQTSSR